MSNLTYNSENKRIATANQNGVANIPAEDSENERILILSDKIAEPNPTPQLLVDSSGFASIQGQEISEDYVDPSELKLSANPDGYIPIGE